VARTVLATLPGSAPYQRLQVALEQGEDGLTICLCEQHHAEGIGWFTQRSMQLEPRQWAQLQGVLGTTDARQAFADDAEDAPATLPFPGPNDPRRLRHAIGDGSN
jgi:hypothetical protein